MINAPKDCIPIHNEIFYNMSKENIFLQHFQKFMEKQHYNFAPLFGGQSVKRKYFTIAVI